MRGKRILFAFNVLLIAILSCNAPGGQTPAEPDLAGTITAQAAALVGPSSTPAPLETATSTLPPTSAIPQVSVTAATNCRTGPGVVYDLIFTMNPGQTAQIIGKYTPANYVIINNPAGGTCWLWLQYAVISGNISGLPEYPPPPTPTPSEPAAPKSFKGTASCSPGGGLLEVDVHASLTWTDLATNEDGYHIFRNDTLLATLAADSTSFEDDTTHLLLIILGTTPPPPWSITYGIEAFNGAGHSSRKEVTLDCQ